MEKLNYLDWFRKRSVHHEIKDPRREDMYRNVKASG